MLLSQEDVFVYGQGNHGQLGKENICETFEPVGLGIPFAKFVGCGFRTSFVIHDCGTYVFGENQKYQLGLGHKEKVRVPTINSFIQNIEEIVGGNKHTIAFCQNLLFV